MNCHAQDVEIQQLTDDGAWCWFSDPRAIYVQENEIVTGWVKKDGSVEAVKFDFTNGQSQYEILFPEMQKDDHNNPAFALLPRNQIFAMYTWHSSKKGIVYHVGGDSGKIDFDQARIIRPGLDNLLNRYPRETFTYANPYYLQDEDVLYAFGRWIGYKPNLIRSNDQGSTWIDHHVIISSEPFDPNNRPYVKYASNGKDRIDLIFTDGHPRIEPFNGVYHCYYQANAFWKSDGTKICRLNELPFDPSEATQIYTPSEETGRAWLADLTLDPNNIPYVLYTRHPKETDHRYHYAWYDREQNEWRDHEICQAGAWFPQTQPGVEEREPHYHGNLSIHPNRPTTIYLSREIDDRFEIEKRTTKDRGASWEVTSVTKNSIYDQVRPYVARGLPAEGPSIILWMQNKKYIHYTDYDSQIRYWVDTD